uniref:Uncharacterized protein n=1 Tax=Aegilops tauschii subsp. strangulata TaxID=200361 RepID=A0A453DC79_AEGTS
KCKRSTNVPVSTTFTHYSGNVFSNVVKNVIPIRATIICKAPSRFNFFYSAFMCHLQCKKYVICKAPSHDI